jgi:hypothetical protein
VSPTAVSVVVYGAYLLANGVGLAISPALPLELLGLPPAEGPWIRVLGLVMAEIGFYFLYAARKELSIFFPATVYGRGFAALVFLILFLFKLGPVQLLMFAVVDLLTATWTQFTIRRSRAV